MKKLLFGIFLVLSVSVFAQENDRDIQAILKTRDEQMQNLKKDFLAKLSKVNDMAASDLDELKRKRLMNQNIDGARAANMTLVRIKSEDLGAHLFGVSQSAAAEAQAASASSDKSKTAFAAPEEKKYNKIVKSSINDQDEKNYPDGTFKYNGHHYYMLPVAMNYDDAKIACETLDGAHLLSIESETEYEYFKNKAIKEGKSFWIDLHYDEAAKTWKSWNSGTSVFLKWEKGFPADIDKKHFSVLINVKNMKADMVNVSGSGFTGMLVCEWEK